MSALFFPKSITWFSKKMEHVLLVDFDSRLIEGVHPIEICGHRARLHKEVEEVTQVVAIHLLHFDDEVVVLAGDGVGFDGALKGLLLDFGEIFAGQEVETI